MSTANRVIKNTGYLYAKMGITMFISLYTTRLILGSLGASDFGIFNIVGGAIAMLGFLNAAMASATQRFMSYFEGEGDREKQKRIFNISVVLHFLLALVVGVVLVFAGWFFFHGILNIPEGRVFAAQVVYASLIVSTMFTVMSVPYDAVLNAHENMRYYAAVGIVESLLKLAVAFATVYTLGDRLIVYGILMACIPLITLTIMRIYCHKHYAECTLHPRRYWDAPLMREMGAFAGWNLITSVSSMVTQYGLGIVLNHFWGVLLNAAQGIANQVSGVLMAFSNNAMKAINPIIVKSEGAKNSKRVIYVTFLGCRASYAIFGLFSLPFIYIMPTILQLWLKEVPIWAVTFCRLQLLRILIEQLTFSLGSAIAAHGEIKHFNLCKSVLNMLPLILVPVAFFLGYEPYWMYFIWIACWSVLNGFVALYFCHKMVKMSIIHYLRQVLLPCLFISIVSIAVYYLLNIFSCHSIATDIFNVVVVTIVYCFAGWFIVLQSTERSMIVDMFNKTYHDRQRKRD